MITQEQFVAQLNRHVAGRFIESREGFKIYLETYGDPDRPAVLLTHGGYQSSQSWRRQVKELAKRWFVIAWDAPWHGQSGPYSAEEINRMHPTGSFLAAGMNAVVEEFHLKEKGFVQVAWSWGGIITNDYLLTYGPQGLCGLVYVAALPDMHAMDKLEPHVREKTAGLFAAKLEDRMEAIFQFIDLLQEKPLSTDEYQALVLYHLQVGLRAFAIPWMTTVGRAGESLALLNQYSCPVLCIHGVHDALIPVSLSEEICASVRTSQLLVYEHCGHSPFLEDAERFNRDIDAFLSGCEKIMPLS